MCEWQSQEKAGCLAAELIKKVFMEGEGGAQGGSQVREESDRQGWGQGIPDRGLRLLNTYLLPRTMVTTLYASNSFNFHQDPKKNDYFSPMQIVTIIKLCQVFSVCQAFWLSGLHGLSLLVIKAAL